MDPTASPSTEQAVLDLRRLAISDVGQIDCLLADSEAARRFGGIIPVCDWVNVAVAIPNQQTWLGWRADKLIGMVTIEQADNDAVCVAVLIAADLRGQGLGRQFLRLVLATTTATRVIAEVEPDNPAGLRLAAAIGLRPDTLSDQGFVRYSGPVQAVVRLSNAAGCA
jgi:RimJ/RimL family protein N-acetyltransferase